MAPRLASMTVEQFQDHWRTSHADAAGQIPGTRRYIQNHAVLEGGALTLPYPGFDACSELDFDSVAAMDEGFASETYQQAVQADEKAFVDKTRFSLVVAEREVVIDGPDLEGVKLITLYHAHPVAGAEGLQSELHGHRAEAIRAAAPQRHDLLFPLSEAHSGERRFLTSDADWHLSGKAFGAARLLARPLQVV
jgi:uncharacterized protein (TIGR02118 family)